METVLTSTVCFLLEDDDDEECWLVGAGDAARFMIGGVWSNVLVAVWCGRCEIKIENPKNVRLRSGDKSGTQ